MQYLKMIIKAKILRLNKFKKGYMIIDGVVVIAIISILFTIIAVSLDSYHKNKDIFLKENKLNDVLKIASLEIKDNYKTEDLNKFNDGKYYYITFNNEKDLMKENFKDKQKNAVANIEEINEDLFIVGFKILENTFSDKVNDDVLDIEVFCKKDSFCHKNTVKKFKCVI